MLSLDIWTEPVARRGFSTRCAAVKPLVDIFDPDDQGIIGPIAYHIAMEDIETFVH